MPFWMKIECDLEAEFLYLGTGRIRAPLFVVALSFCIS